MQDWKRDQRDKGIPRQFPAPERSYALYEGIDYQEHWEGPHQARQDALERHLLSGLLPASGRRIVDLGCGYGRLAPIYLDRFEVSVLYDGSLSLLQEAQRIHGDRVTLVAGDLSRLPFRDATFDCVMSIRVLQHVRDLPAVLGPVRRVSAPGSAFVFSYYNKRNALRVLRYPQTRTRGNPFTTESAEISPTMIAHHPRRFEDLLVDAGFSSPTYRGAVVVDSLARLGERFGRRSPAGTTTARATGNLRLAPWLIGRSHAAGAPTSDDAGGHSSLFACPQCRSDLDQSDAGFHCPACQRTFPIVNGIFDFRS